MGIVVHGQPGPKHTEGRLSQIFLELAHLLVSSSCKYAHAHLVGPLVGHLGRRQDSEW